MPTRKGLEHAAITCLLTRYMAQWSLFPADFECFEENEN